MIRHALTDQITTDYREAWFDTLDSLKGAGLERQSRGADRTEYPDPSGDTIGDNEARRKSLANAALKLDKALALVIDAKGLIAFAGGAQSSGVKDGATQTWTKQEMDAVNGEMPSRNKVRT
jgi:hypothetical protein